VALGVDRRKRGEYQDDVTTVDVDLQIEGNGGCTIGLGSGAVGFSSDEINGYRELDFANNICQEEEGTSGHSDDYGRQ